MAIGKLTPGKLDKQSNNLMKGFCKLTDYNKAFNLAMDIFEMTKNFPPEEKYELNNQIRRSSRVVCRAICEGLKKAISETFFK